MCGSNGSREVDQVLIECYHVVMFYVSIHCIYLCMHRRNHFVHPFVHPKYRILTQGLVSMEIYFEQY